MRRSLSLVAVVVLLGVPVFAQSRLLRQATAGAEVVIPVSGCPTGSTPIETTDTPQTIIDAHSAGTVYCFQEGTHRITTPIAPKLGDTIRGELAGDQVTKLAILSGARNLTASTWTQTTCGAYTCWSVPGQTQENSDQSLDADFYCVPGYERCIKPEDLFFDGTTLKRHAVAVTGVTTGYWFFNYTTHLIYVGDNPSGHTVETSVTARLFTQSSVDNVTVSDLIVEKFAGLVNYGCVNLGYAASGGTGWLATRLEVRHCHGAGIHNEPFTTARNNYVHHNGQYGFHGAGSTILVEDNEVAFNNVRPQFTGAASSVRANTWGFDGYWGAGGSKWDTTDGLIVRHNLSYENDGPGFWTDFENINTLYTLNTLLNNMRGGIFHEISRRAEISYNTATGNGAGHDYNGFTDGAGIQVTDSEHVWVHHNTLSNNWNEITALDDDRSGYIATLDMIVEFNQVSNTNVTSGNGRSGWKDNFGVGTIYNHSSNIWRSNTYALSQTNAFICQAGDCSFATWQGTDVQDGGSSLNGSNVLTPWLTAEIGSGQTTGTCARTGDDFTITGAGITFGTTDQGHYCYQPITDTDIEIVAHLTSLTSAAAYGEFAGIMLRQSLAADAVNAYCGIVNQADGAILAQWRTTTGGTTESAGQVVSAHQWLRVTLVGSVWSCMYGDTSTGPWTFVTPGRSFSSSGTYYYGPYVHSHLGNLATAVIEDVTVTELVSQPNENTTDYGGYRAHLQGIGADTVGGRGGSVCKVTTLNYSGAGSLKACAETSGARIVVFERSGTIDCAGGYLFIVSPYMTIAGQTAPAPGILLKRCAIEISTHDIVMQHLRIRMGDMGSAVIPIHIKPTTDAYNIIIDHNSISWGTSTLSTANQHSSAIMYADNIFSEMLSSGYGGGNPQGAANLFYPGDECSGTVVRNLYAHNGNRNPWIGGGCRVALINNVAYNPYTENPDDNGSRGFTQLISVTSPHNAVTGITEIYAVNNRAIAGPQTDTPSYMFKIGYVAAQIASGVRIYLNGNQGPSSTGLTGDGQWADVKVCTSCGAEAGNPNVATKVNTRINTQDAWSAAYNFQAVPTADVLTFVLTNAGARPTERDTPDTRIAHPTTGEVALHTGGLKDTTSTLDYPTLAVNTQTYTTPAGANNPGTCGTTTAGVVRTVIECDLETKARALEPRW